MRAFRQMLSYLAFKHGKDRLAFPGRNLPLQQADVLGCSQFLSQLHAEGIKMPCCSGGHNGDLAALHNLLHASHSRGTI